MPIVLLLFVLVGIVVAFHLYRQETPYMEFVIGGLTLLALGCVILPMIRGGRLPAPGTDFEQSVAWKLASMVSTSRAAGDVVILLDGVLKDSPSYLAQRGGIEAGLRSGLKPVWIDLPAGAGGEFEGAESPRAPGRRGRVIFDAVQAADDPVAVLSLVPVTSEISDGLLKRLPLVFTYEQDHSPVTVRRLKIGEYGAVAMPRSDADNTQKPAGSHARRFDQRFTLVQP